MSGDTKTRDAFRKNHTFKSAVTEAKDKVKGEDGYDKRFTSLKTAEMADAAGVDTGVSRPTDEQLAVINTYTRTPKMADEVAVFNTLSCNDLEDRDEDKFTTETVKDFAALPAPLGPNGKSFMVGHDYTKLPVGRIFSTDTANVEEALFMTNSVYVPNTPQYQTFLENQDYGIYWAVSVGVMLDSNECSICEAPMSRWMNGCYEGHFKGAYYDPADERDKTGWPIERKPTDAGAVKCIGLMKGARDFYELSQVFLGAQFYAELADKSKSPEFAGVLKAASGHKIPIIGLSAKEAEALPLPHVDPRVAEALKKYEPEHDADGDIRWTDDQNFRWVFSAGEVLCIGKAPADDEVKEDPDGTGSGDLELGGSSADDPDALGEPEGEHTDPAERGSGVPDLNALAGDGQPGDDGRRSVGDLTERVAAVRSKITATRAAATDDEGTTDPSVADLLSAMDGVVDQAEQDLTDGNTDAVASALDALDSTIDDIAEDLGVSFDDSDDTSEGKKANEKMSKREVLAAAVRAKVPAAVLTKVSEAQDDGLGVLVGTLMATNKQLAADKAALAPKAELGETYIKALREEALEWYVKANSDGAKGVKVETFTKVLDACGDNVDLVRELLAEQKSATEARYGVKTIRSTVDADVQNITDGPDRVPGAPVQEKSSSDSRVTKLHG